MSRGWDPDAVITSKSAGWLSKTGVFGTLRAFELRHSTRGQLWKQWIAKGCPLPAGCSEKEGFAFSNRLKSLLAGAGGVAHPAVIRTRVAKALGPDKPATIMNVARLIGPATPAEITAIQIEQGLAPRKRPRPARPGILNELMQVFPVNRQRMLEPVFKEAARRGTPIAPLHIGRVLNLQRELQSSAALVLLDCSWKGKSPATFAAYLGGIEEVDDFLIEEPGLRLHRLLDRLDARAETFDERTLVGLRKFALAIGATRKFAVQQFGSAKSVGIFMDLCDPFSLATIMRSAREVIDERDDRKGGEREDQVLIDMHQSERMDRLVKQRQAFVELAFNNYLEKLKQSGGTIPGGGLRFAVQTPVFDADGHSVGGAEQLVWFRIDTAGNVARRAAARNQPGPMRHVMAARIARLDAKKPTQNSDLREDLIVLFERCDALQPGGPTIEPFFVQLFRWGILEGSIYHPPLIQEQRELLLEQVGFVGDWRPGADLLCLPQKMRWIARAARGNDPRLGEIVIPLVALHHGLLLGTLCHEVVRAECPRTHEILQIQLGPEFIGKELPGRKGKYPIKMRPKHQAALQQYNVSENVLRIIARVVNLANRRWFPECMGVVHRLPVRPSRLYSSKPLPDGQYVFSHATGVLGKDELGVLRHVLLWDVSVTTIHAGRFTKATALGLAGELDTTKTRILKQKKGSQQFRRYDRSDGLLANKEAHAHANEKIRND